MDRQRRQRRQGVVSGVAWVLGLAALGMVGLGLGGGPMGHRAALRPVASTATGTDTTPPLALTLGGGPNEDGWYSELADYRWSAKDPESGIDWCQAGSIDPVESAVPRTVYGTCVNGAGIAATYAGFSYRYDATRHSCTPSRRRGW